MPHVRFHVLIAAPATMMRRQVRRALAWRPDLHVREAASGQEALDAATRIAPDLVITTRALPDMSGMALVREVQQASAATRSLVLAPRLSAEEALDLLNADVDAMLVLPLDAERLVRQVAQLLGTDLPSADHDLAFLVA